MMITHAETITGFIALAGIAGLALGFAGGQEYRRDKIAARLAERHELELDRVDHEAYEDGYQEGLRDGRADRAVGGPGPAEVAAAEVPGVRRPGLDRSDLGESPGPEPGGDVREGFLRRGADPVRAADDLGADSPGLRDPRELGDPPAAPAPPQGPAWEPAPGDLILQQAGAHYNPAWGTLSTEAYHPNSPGPVAGVNLSAGSNSQPGTVRQDTKAGPSGPGGHPDVLELLDGDLQAADDHQVFSLIRENFQALRAESYAWRPVLPGWTGRRAA